MCIACNKDFVAEMTVIKQHGKGNKHLSLCVNIKPSQRTIPDSLQPVEKVDPLKRSIQKGEIKIAAFISEHHLAFNVVDHLTKLIHEICTDS
jgi:hypothetical protein